MGHDLETAGQDGRPGPASRDGRRARGVTRSGSPRLRLEYLDGLRGIAALYVVLFHSMVGFRGDVLPPALVSALKFMTYGHFSVAVFIVLSGYCLMLPVARSSDGRLSGGFAGYVKRRALRILPPYYAAVSISLLVIRV